MSAAKKKDEHPDAPVQSEEVRNAILNKSTGGRGTAIGTIREERDREDTPEGEDRGSTLPIAGTFDKGDAIEGLEPQGAQTQPAILATNGTVPVNMVGSPSGPIPVSAVVGDPAQGAKLVQERLDQDEKEVLKTGYAKLSRAKVESMNANELRAVASDRGYDVGQNGSRLTRQRFLEAQKNDKGFDSQSDEEIQAGETGAPQTEE